MCITCRKIDQVLTAGIEGDAGVQELRKAVRRADDVRADLLAEAEDLAREGRALLAKTAPLHQHEERLLALQVRASAAAARLSPALPEGAPTNDWSACRQ